MNGLRLITQSQLIRHTASIALAFGFGSAVLVYSYQVPFWKPWGGVLLMGIIGGLGVGLTLGMRRLRTALMAIGCAVGFWVGLLIGENVVKTVRISSGETFLVIPPFSDFFILGGIMGAAGGLLMGLVTKNLKLIIGFPLAGFIGFGIGYGISMHWVLKSGFPDNVLGFVMMGLVGGAAIGATAGFLHKRNNYWETNRASG